MHLLSPVFGKAWGHKNSFICPSDTKSLTLAITIALLQVEL